jgi:tRNA nucleotidyltransferase/poly(A) polymerase
MNSPTKTIALMRFLSRIALEHGVGDHTYVVGGAVRNHILGVPVKDLDLVIDSVALGVNSAHECIDSRWFACMIQRAIPAETNFTENQYGVAILTVHGDWELDGFPMRREVIEIANARKESYAGVGGKGKGYKPTDIQPATIQEDLLRREFTFNTLLWKLGDLAEGPKNAPVIDLLGRGLGDLMDGVIKTPLDPDRTFGDDPTRMLRAVKFQVKYDLEISPEVERSIRKNASKLTQMPWEAVGTILIRDLLNGPDVGKAISTMRYLGLLDVVTTMIRETPSFASYVAGQYSTSEDVKFLVLLDDMELTKRPLGFLAESQRERLKVAIVGMDDETARRLFEMLKKPPLNNESLIADFKLEGRARSTPTNLARGVIIDMPEVLDAPERVEEIVRTMLQRLPAVL